MPRATRSPSISKQVRTRIEQGGERAWKFEEFTGLPFTAVAQALSRMTRKGELTRLSRGIYYRSRSTAFGASQPTPRLLLELASRNDSLFPAGLSAANLLGFTTQVPAKSELATVAASMPRRLLGKHTVVHTRRPAAWADLSDSEAALLDFLRGRGSTSELTPKQTANRTLRLLKERGRLRRLLEVAETEPPRVRAMLGALGEQAGASPRELARLRESLNPLSRFDFGALAVLRGARAWQAKDVL
jgi:hypothetical protein